MAPHKSSWAKFGKAIHVLVVVAFFLPFFGVSCDGIDVVSVSGADMVGGCQPGGAITQAEPSDPESSNMKLDPVAIEPLAVIALVLVIAALVLSFLGGRRMIIAALVSSLLAIGTLVGLGIKVNSDIKAEIADKMELDRSPVMRGAKIDSGPRVGLWIALAGLAGGAVLAAFALRSRLPAAGPAPPDGTLPAAVVVTSREPTDDV